jgi:outer membrane scaffolding protein for murein synthesis (MipA/OmpV family)
MHRHPRPALWLASSLLAAAAATHPARAQDVDSMNERRDDDGKAVWSLGLGVVAMRLPDYRGSDESRNRVLPFPAFFYRGPRVQATREGIRAELFEGSRFELDLSLAGSLPVRSEGNRARSGMPDLDPTVEFGPSLNAWLWRSEAGDSELSLRMPLRAAMNVDRDGLHMRGWQFGPRLQWRTRSLPGLEGWRVGVSGGPLWGSRRWHAYFYEVAPQYARTDRPAYEAHGGYAGLQATLSASRSFGPWSVFGFVRADSLSGAAFEDSPLVKQRSNTAFGFGVSRSFWGSSDARP